MKFSMAPESRSTDALSYLCVRWIKTYWGSLQIDTLPLHPLSLLPSGMLVMLSFVSFVLPGSTHNLQVFMWWRAGVSSVVIPVHPSICCSFSCRFSGGFSALLWCNWLVFGFLIGLKFVCHHPFDWACKSFDESLCSVDSFQQLFAVNVCFFKVRDVPINVWPFCFYSDNALPSLFWYKPFEEGLYKGISYSWVLMVL